MTMLGMYERLGAYTVLERLGKGGMGEVYHAHHDELGDVAIKLLPGVRQGARGRLLREASFAVSLDHPNIITVYGIGEHRGLPYIIMELLVGLTLKEMIRAGTETELEWRLAVMKQILGALTYAHEAGVMHRDIKPQNIFLLHEGGLRVLDFGLAQPADATTTGADKKVGTPSYTPPEQVLGNVVDHRGDIFSLGAVFYELLSGSRAFGGTSMGEVLERVAHHDPTPVHELDERIPEELSGFLRKAMAKEPDQRYESMRAMLEALERFEGDLAALREDIRRQVSELLAPLGKIDAADPGPPDLQIPLQLPAEYFDLMALQQRLEGQRDTIERLGAELQWTTELLTAPLDELDEDSLRAIADRADSLREVWPTQRRAGDLGQRVLEELRSRLSRRQPVDWGNTGGRPRGDTE